MDFKRVLTVLFSLESAGKKNECEYTILKLLLRKYLQGIF